MVLWKKSLCKWKREASPFIPRIQTKYDFAPDGFTLKKSIFGKCKLDNEISQTLGGPEKKNIMRLTELKLNRIIQASIFYAFHTENWKEEGAHCT